MGEWASVIIGVAALIAALASIPPSGYRRISLLACCALLVAAVAVVVVSEIHAGDSRATTATPSSTTSGSPAAKGSATAEQPTSASLPATTYLTQKQPLGRTPLEYKVEPVQLKGTTYQQGIRFVCQNAVTSLVYDVSKAKYLNAVVGVPDDAKNETPGVRSTITFYKDDSDVALVPPVVADRANPQTVSVDLQGAAQLKISCSTNTPGTTFSGVALVTPTLGAGPG